MKNWVLSVITTVFIISLIALILPNGKLSKHVKNTLSFIVVLVIVSPIINLKNIEVINDDLNNIANHISKESVDVVMVNPPYRKSEDHIISTNEHLNICNYEIKVTLEDIIKNAESILKFGGKLFMVNDINRLEETIVLLNKYSFKTKILQLVNPNMKKQSNVFLLQATKKGKSGIKVPFNVILNDENGNYMIKIKKGKNER